MKQSLKRIALGFLALMFPCLGWAELPTAAWTWDGNDGTDTGVKLDSGEKVYTVLNKYIDMDTNGVTVPANGFTFSFWTKRAGSNWRNYAGFSDTTAGLMIQQNDKGTMNIYGSGAMHDKAGDQRFNLAADPLQLVTFVSKEGTLYTYVNGTLSNTFTPSTTAWPSFSQNGQMRYFALGAAPSTSGTQAGNAGCTTYIADARVYNQALTAEQVKELYDDYATRAAAMAYQRTVTETAVDWSATDAWTLNEEKSSAPEGGKPVLLTVNADSTITMNADATVGALTIGGTAKATFDGANALNASSTAVNTDVDVSGITASLGAVTIAAEKTLTATAETLTFGSLAGAGTLNLGATSVDEEYAPSWAAASTTPIKWTKGKLTFATGSNGSGYPKNAPLTVTGADAQMVLKTNTDTTGYNGGSASLTIADGAKLVVEKRDTFNRSLILNNASMSLSGDNLDGGRAIDFYTNSSLTSSGTSSITGANATANDYGDNTVGSGIIAIRRANLEIAVNDGTLSCYAQFGGADGYGDAATGVAVKKTGSGTLALYRAAANNVPVQVNAGTLKLVNDGGLSNNSYTIADGATLAVSVIADKTKTMTTTFNGPGKIVKQDAGTLDLGGATFGATSPAFEVEGGMLILPAGAEGTETDGVISSCVTVAEGAKVGIRLTAAQVASSYTAKVADDTTVEFYDGTTKLESDGKTYTCPVPVWTPTGSTITFDSTDCWSGDEVPAGGVIIIDTSAYSGENDITLVVSKSYTSITVVGNAEKVTDISFANDVTVAPAIFIAGKVKLPISVINDVNVSISSYGDDAILIADVAEDATLTKALSGNYAFWKDGAGTMTLNANITVDDGVEILDGTLKFGVANGTKYTIGGTEYGTQGNVKVHKEAVLDVNGVADAFLNMVTLCEGAVFANDGDSELSNGSRQLKGITLEGDATVRATKNFGILASGHAQSTLNLGGKTLTKTGAGSFWLSNTDVSNGTLKVVEGNFTSVNTAPRFASVTFDSDLADAFASIGNGAISGTVTKKGTGSLTLNGTISGSEALIVEGGTLVLTAANASLGAITIAEGKTLTVANTATFSALSGLGNLVIDVTNGGVDDSLLDILCAFPGSITFISSNAEMGITLNHGTGSESLQAQYIFDGGTHCLTYGVSGDNGTKSFAINRENPDDNPAVWVKNGATVTWNTADLSGWNGSTLAQQVIRVDNASLTFDDRNGTEFFRNRLLLGDEASVTISADKFHVYGGVGSSAADAQIAMIASEADSPATATITGSLQSGGFTGPGTYGTKGMGIAVGANSTLDIKALLGNQEIVKYGEGTLLLSTTDNTFNNTMTVNEGVLKLTGSLNCTTIVSADATLSGTGTIDGMLTFEAGATLDATAGALTVTGAVAVPSGENEIVNVKVTNANYGPVLRAANLNPDKFALADGATGLLVATDAELVYTAIPAIPQAPDVNIPDAVMKEIATAAAEAGVSEITIVGATIGDKTVDVAGLDLFENVPVTITSDGESTTGTATVSYAFGITSMSLVAQKDANGKLTGFLPTVTAKVSKIDGTKGPTIAEGVTVELYAGEEKIGTATLGEDEDEDEDPATVTITDTTPINFEEGTTTKLIIKATNTPSK